MRVATAAAAGGGPNACAPRAPLGSHPPYTAYRATPSYVLHRPPCSSIALTEAHVKGFMAQILEGVAYLHAHRLMHR